MKHRQIMSTLLIISKRIFEKYFNLSHIILSENYILPLLLLVWPYSPLPPQYFQSSLSIILFFQSDIRHFIKSVSTQFHKWFLDLLLCLFPSGPLLKILSGTLSASWPNHFNLLILIKDTKSRFTNMFSNYYCIYLSPNVYFWCSKDISIYLFLVLQRYF